MSSDIPHDVLNHLVEAVNDMRKMVDDLRFVWPAIGITNQQKFAAAPGHLADLHVTEISLGKREITSARLLKYGQTEWLNQPELVHELLEKAPQPDPDAIPPAPTELPGSHKAPGLNVVRHIQGAIVRLKIADTVAPGTRVYIRLENARDLPLHAIFTIPDHFPWGDGQHTGFLARPELIRFDEVEPHGHLETLLTQPCDAAQTEQIILFYSYLPYLLAPKIIIWS